MEILYHQNFLKHYRKRILPSTSLDQRFKERVDLFRGNPNHPLLKNHKLTGRKDESFAFSVTGNIRVVYKITKEVVTFIDIGSHNQVY